MTAVNALGAAIVVEAGNGIVQVEAVAAALLAAVMTETIGGSGRQGSCGGSNNGGRRNSIIYFNCQGKLYVLDHSVPG